MVKEYKKLYVDVPRDVYRKLKVMAAEREVFLKELVNELLSSFVSS